MRPALRERRYSEDTARQIDRAVKKTVDKAFGKAVDILNGRRPILGQGAQALMQRETLVEDELLELMATRASNAVTVGP